MKNRLLLVVLGSLLAMFLVACQPPALYKAADRSTREMQMRMQALDNRVLDKQPAVLQVNSSYIDSRPVSFDNAPSWLRARISLRGQGLPFRYFAEKIVKQIGVYTNYQNGMDINLPISMDYEGPIAGALDKLASRTGYAYNVTRSNITWTAYVTKTFNVSFMPGASSYLMGRNQSGAESTSGGNTNGQAGNSGNTNSSSNSSQGGSEYSSLGGQLSVWKDLRNGLNQLKSKNGKVMVSEATTTVTVRDHPENVRSIERYINELNGDLSREVLIQVQVLDLKLNRAFNYGVDWHLIARNFNLKGDMSKPINILPVGGNDPHGISIGYVHGDTSILLHALEQQGNLSTATYPRVVTMNNQVAQIGINTETTYIAQSSTTATTQVGTTTSVTPGVINEGFTLYLLPKIQDESVYMQISSTISQLVSLTQQNFGPAGSPTSSIQLPQVALKRFNQRTVVPNGATLILAGFKQIRNEANKSALLGSYQLGDKGASQDNVETIVLITPTIIRRN